MIQVINDRSVVVKLYRQGTESAEDVFRMFDPRASETFDPTEATEVELDASRIYKLQPDDVIHVSVMH